MYFATKVLKIIELRKLFENIVAFYLELRDIDEHLLLENLEQKL